MFDAPGNLSEFSSDLLQIWNDMIVREITSRSASRFFVTNPEDVVDREEIASVRWSGAPAEPRFCLNREWAQKLSDWGIKGRHRTHNEYCEYRLVTAIDEHGTVRPKRVEFTSELREYWTVLAMYDPNALQNAVDSVIGRASTWRELYDHDDPFVLSESQRRVRFSYMVAGNGYHQDLVDAGVPTQPTGPLNQDNLLFMTHPINGLDDLIYVVMFGAFPYRVQENGTDRKALLQEIFRAGNAEQLACRNADPAAAAGPFNVVSEGRHLAFSKNLGMYLRPLNKTIFEFNDQQIPDEWVTYSRGGENMYQRLVFGPSDDEKVYLDEIVIKKGDAREPVIGGYQVAEVLEVGPLVVVGPPSNLDPSDLKFIPADSSVISCSEATICDNLKTLKSEYEAATEVIPHGVRGRI